MTWIQGIVASLVLLISSLFGSTVPISTTSTPVTVHATSTTSIVAKPPSVTTVQSSTSIAALSGSQVATNLSNQILITDSIGDDDNCIIVQPQNESLSGTQPIDLSGWTIKSRSTGKSYTLGTISTGATSSTSDVIFYPNQLMAVDICTGTTTTSHFSTKSISSINLTGNTIENQTLYVFYVGSDANIWTTNSVYPDEIELFNNAGEEIATSTVD